jgi:hypothetical protein
MSTATQRWISQHHGNRITTVAEAMAALVPTLFDGAGWFTLDDTAARHCTLDRARHPVPGMAVFRRRKRLFKRKAFAV